MTQDAMDLTCLRALRVDGESDRVAITAASIIVHAHAIARKVPDASDDVLRIVDLTRRLYAILPSREVVRTMVDEGLGEVAACRGDRLGIARARERLVESLWRHFQHGASHPGRGRGGRRGGG